MQSLYETTEAQEEQMAEQHEYDANGDGRHEFRSATVSADDEKIVDDQGHDFRHGRVSPQDEVEQE